MYVALQSVKEQENDMNMALSTISPPVNKGVNDNNATTYKY